MCVNPRVAALCLLLVVSVGCLRDSALSSAILTTPAQDESTCGSVDIRNNVSIDVIRKLKNCSRIEGHLRIVLIEHESRQRLDAVSFPLLTEITDYLLIYRVKHVTTIANWFPNLKYIRGRKLFDGNAIIIRDLPDLVHLGLHSLEHIKGGVRIEDTKNLCFEQTPDFHIIAEAIKSSTRQTIDQRKTQLLPGFALQSRHPYQLNAKWNHTLFINNQTIDHFYIKLIEFEDLEFYYKAVQRNKCSIEDGIERPPEDEHMVCDRNQQKNFIFGRVDNYSPKDVLMAKESEDILNNIQNAVYQSNIYMNSSDPRYKQNELKSKSEMKSEFDQQIYHVSGVVIAPLQANISAVKWDDYVKHFQDYYVIVYACDKKDRDCFVVAHQKNKTAAVDTADDIPEDSVGQEVNKSEATVHIKWSEPERPNGAIISYEIHLHESRNKTNKKTYCVDRWQWRQSNGFVVTHLKYNTKYVYKLRAISLNGPPIRWTKDYEIFIRRDDSANPLKWVLIVLCPVLVFLLLATFCYIKYPRKSDSQLNIVSVNPEYYSCQVDPMWEVSRNDLKLFDVLGDGNFGQVHYAELSTNNKKIKCAVKTLNLNRTHQREAFLREANIMKSFVDCHHIVKLIGIVSIDNPVLVLMEYMENGDLRRYLRRNRPDSDENPNPRVPTWNRIFQMAIEISDGMAYLSARKFVHRDLAARNCLVAEDLTVKIGDFGMARDIYDNDYYRRRDWNQMPVRWMAPEAIEDGVFTTYSDIWSYGVVLYEIVTLGAQPYQGYSNEAVLHGVVQGMRLKEPDDCPKKLWKIMQKCWEKKPKMRPSFNEITEYLLPSANQAFRDNCYYLRRKPFISTDSSIKKMFYAFIPNGKLLLNAKEKEMEDFDFDQQYCQMKPQIHRKETKMAREFTEEEIEVLNKLNEINININNFDDETNRWNIDHKKDIGNKEGKLIEC